MERIHDLVVRVEPEKKDDDSRNSPPNYSCFKTGIRPTRQCCLCLEEVQEYVIYPHLKKCIENYEKTFGLNEPEAKKQRSETKLMPEGLPLF